MANFVYFSGSILSFYFGNIFSDRSGHFLLIVLILLAIVGCFLLVMNFKKRFDFTKGIIERKNEEIIGLENRKQTLKREITELENENQNLKYVKKLENTLKEKENERNELENTKNQLLQEIEELEDKIKHLEKGGSKKNSDTIIEYYLNENSK